MLEPFLKPDESVYQFCIMNESSQQTPFRYWLTERWNTNDDCWFARGKYKEISRYMMLIIGFVCMQWKHNMEIVYNSVNTVTYLFHREWDLHVKHLSWSNQKSPTGDNRKHLQLKAKYSNCYYWLVPPIDNDLYAHSTITWLNISNSQAYY